jgi:tetratricopeptide (TPR) repeat protein
MAEAPLDFDGDRIFVDRDGPKRVFAEAARSIPADGRILRVWHGIGGQGKTALQRELVHIVRTDPQYSPLRWSLVDLHGKPKTDPERLLVWIRNGFAESGVPCPAFDLAFALHWDHTRGDEALPKLTKSWLHRGSEAVEEASADTLSFTLEGLDSVLQSVPFLGFLAKKGVRWSVDKGKRAWIDRACPYLRQALYQGGQLRPDHEIAERLPWLLAQDLNHYREANAGNRFVLFVDEYESVLDGAGTGAHHQDSPFDKHMRRFISETRGLLAVFFTREPLPWGKAWEAELNGNQHSLDGLADTDAEAWLLDVPIPDPALRAAMIEGARERPKPEAPVFPFLLDLQVLHWRDLGDRARPEDFRTEAETFEGRRQELVQRLLRNYDRGIQEALEILCLPERFDRTAFEQVVTTFHLPLSFGTFDDLAKLSLMTRGEDGWLSPHRAVADAIVQEMSSEARKRAEDMLIEHFAERANPPLPKDVTTEAEICLREAARLRLAQGVEGYAGWLGLVTQALRDAARFTFLEPVLTEALNQAKAAFGEEHTETAIGYNNLASVLGDQGRYREAEPFLRQGLAICVAALGEDHPAVGVSYNNLALNLNAQGRYAEAEPLLRQGLAICVAALGEDHPTVGASYNNLASNLDAQGRYAEAEPLLRQGLAICVAALGEDHPTVGASYNNLALNLNAQGRYAEAEPLYRQGLAICVAALGEDHPTVGASYNNLASNLNAQGRYAEAEPLYRQGLAIRAAALGEDHPDVGASYNNLAFNLNAQGRYGEAEPLYRQGLAIRAGALGEDHPAVGESYNNLAFNLDAQGRHAEAEPCYRKALNILDRSLGPHHPNTQIVRENLAIFLDNQGRPDEAERVRRGESDPS